MDEMTLGWVKMYRQAYPKLSVTMEAMMKKLATSPVAADRPLATRRMMTAKAKLCLELPKGKC